MSFCDVCYWSQWNISNKRNRSAFQLRTRFPGIRNTEKYCTGRRKNVLHIRQCQNVNIKKACWGEIRLPLTKDSYFAYASASWFWNNSPGRVYLSLHFNIHSTACFEYLPGLRCGLKPVGNMHFLIPKYARNCDRPIIVFPAYKSEGDNLLRWGSKIRKAQEVEEILLKIRLF